MREKTRRCMRITIEGAANESALVVRYESIDPTLGEREKKTIVFVYKTFEELVVELAKVLLPAEEASNWEHVIYDIR
jgi:hypothetical protein